MLSWWTPEGRSVEVQRAIRYQIAVTLAKLLVGCTICENWKTFLNGIVLRFVIDGQVYERDVTWLLDCDFSDIPQPERNDLLKLVRNEGFCT